MVPVPYLYPSTLSQAASRLSALRFESESIPTLLEFINGRPLLTGVCLLRSLWLGISSLAHQSLLSESPEGSEGLTRGFDSAPLRHGPRPTVLPDKPSTFCRLHSSLPFSTDQRPDSVWPNPPPLPYAPITVRTPSCHSVHEASLHLLVCVAVSSFQPHILFRGFSCGLISLITSTQNIARHTRYSVSAYQTNVSVH